MSNYNRSERKVAALVAQGGRAAGSVAEAVSDVDVTLTVLPDSPDVEAVAHELIGNARPRSLWVDASTIRPDVAVSLAEAAAKRAVRAIDAPVSGGEQGAVDASLSIMVGGTGPDVAAARPVLETLGSTVAHVGPSGIAVAGRRTVWSDMRIILAPDKFKGSLSAPLVAAHLAIGIHGHAPDAEVVSLPVADGGDGFLDAALAAGYRENTVPAQGPTGQPIRARYGERDKVAVIELAETAGLQALPGGELAPMTASSYGTGLVMRAALDAGCRSILIGLGGSACTDGGAGLLRALGAKLHGSLVDLTGVDLSHLHPALPETKIMIASDVDNPLLGATGAAAVYGPQKGASQEEVALLDRALTNWAEHLGTELANAPGAGAAGGVGYGLMAALGATMRPGIEIVLDMTDFDKALTDAQLVVTGEGSLDEQTLHGKAVAGVAARARSANVPVVAVAGRSTLDSGQLETAGISSAFTLADLEPDLDVCMTSPGPILERIGGQIARRCLR